jgi:integrase
LRYSLGTDPATGKRRVVTTTVRGDSKAAGKELRRLLHSIDNNTHVDPSRITVSQWLETWLASVKPNVSPKSHERYAQLVLGFLTPELGNYPLVKLSPVNILAAYTKWNTEGRLDGKPGGPAPRTRRHIHHLLRTALAHAVELQMLARNPTDALKRKLPKVERRMMKILDTQQSDALLRGLKHSRVYWPCLLALSTGMRRGEILALRWKNVDLDRGVLQVVESLEQTKEFGVRAKETKTGKARSVTLPRFAIDELRRLRREQAEELLRLGVRQTGETLVCGRADGEPHQPRSLTHEFAVLIARLKDVPRVRFHDLRHTHATALLRAGIHPKIAQERLGHSTITTTLDLYSHVTDSMQKDAADRLDAAFRSAISGGTAG